MGMRIMLEVSQPVHGPDGQVLYQPGERFPLDADLEGVPVRIVQVPDDEVAPAPAPAEEKPAGKKAPAK